MGDCRECTIAAAIGFAADICQQEHITLPELEKIKESGYESEDEVLKVLEEFNKKVPENRKVEAQSIKCFAFQNHNECKLSLSDE